MNISTLSSSYTVRKLMKQDIDAVYQLSIANTLYYKHCPPLVTKESILKDMKALPNNKTYDDKYYLGFWDNDKLIAILDLITNYPNIKPHLSGCLCLIFLFRAKVLGAVFLKEFQVL